MEMIQEDTDRLKKSGFKVERTPTGYVFTLEQRDKFGDLYAGKEECEVIPKIGKIVEMRAKIVTANLSLYIYTSTG
jgi:hypothetical protein